MSEAEKLAKRFHELYEKLAPSFGYATRKDSAVPWEDVPATNKDLMIAVCTEILGGGRDEAISGLIELWTEAEDAYAGTQDEYDCSWAGLVGHLKVLGVSDEEIAQARERVE